MREHLGALLDSLGAQHTTRLFTELQPDFVPTHVIMHWRRDNPHRQAMVIRQALERTDGNQSEAARLLGLTRAKLRYRMQKHSIESEG